MPNRSLLEKTVAMLHRRKGEYRKIALETSVEYDWLQKISQGAITDPGVNKVERLHDYLAAAESSSSGAAA